MAGEPPCYFFSYARKDWDKYLEKFFNEIERRIVKDGGRDPEMLETGFLDRKDIKTGDDWNDRLADGLSRCLSLLSIYTPWYFKRPYCGKEFQVFLDRQDAVSYEADGTVAGSKKILPVLWVRKRHLQQKMPPVTGRIQFTPSVHRERYENDGLRRILEKTGARGAFSDLANEIADRLLELADSEPLKELEPLPKFENTQNAFDRSLAEPSPTPSPDTVFLGMLVPDADWEPIDDLDSGGIRPELAEMAGRLQLDTCFSPPFSSGHKSTEIVAELASATNNNAPVVLVVDSSWLDTPASLDSLKAVLGDNSWRGAVLIVQQNSDGIPEDVYKTLRDAWAQGRTSSERELLVELGSSPSSLNRAFTFVLVDAQRRVSEHGVVTRRGEGGATVARPLLDGPGGQS